MYLVTTKWIVSLHLITYHVKVNEPWVSSFVCITLKFNQEVNGFSQVLTELLLISAYRFSRLISIQFLRELVAQIGLKIKAFSPG